MWLSTNNYKSVEISIKYYKNIYFIDLILCNMGHWVCGREGITVGTRVVMWDQKFDAKNTGGHPSGILLHRTTLDRGTQ